MAPTQNRVLNTVLDSGKVYLKGVINHKEHECLLDTGSEITVFPQRLVHDSCIRPTRQRMCAANGTPLELAGETEIWFDFEGCRVKVYGVVSNRVYEIMLGQDFLTQNRATWDFSQSKIVMHGQEFQLYAVETTGWCRRVILHDDTEIPAWSETTINGEQMYRNSNVPNHVNSGLWTTGNHTIEGSLQVARTLVNGDKDMIPVRVMNTTLQPILLKKGTLISELEETDSIVEETPDGMGGTSLLTEGVHIQPIMDGVDNSVSPEDRVHLQALLGRYTDIFSQGEYDLGRTHVVEHYIDTGNNRPVRQSLRRQPPLYQNAIQEQTEQMLKAGIIRPTNSEWASNVVLVRKHDGSLRFCVDYRAVNDVSKKDSFPLPRIDQCLDSLSGSNWFSTFDLVSGYH